MVLRFKKLVHSTRFKTTIWYSLIFLILEIVIGTIIYFYLGGSLSKQLDLSLTKQAELIYNFVSEKNIDFYNFMPDSNYASPDDLIYDLAYEEVALNPNNTFIQVKFKNKIIFQTENLKNSNTILSDSSAKEEFIKSFYDNNLSQNEIRAVVLNKKGYQIISAFSISHINRVLESLIDLYIIIVPIFLLISVVGGAIISVKSLSRIDSIIERTRFITAQNLEEIISGGEFDDEYGRLTRTMNEMIYRIKKSIDYMNQFSISAAHELKTPLTILRGEIEIALRSEMTPNECREVLKSNLDETLRLINIVEKLFFISKTDHMLVKVNKEKIEINELLLSRIEALKKMAEEKGIRLILEKSEAIYTEVDKVLINQVIHNLIENAIKFSDSNASVIIRLGKRGLDKIYFSVTNKGEYIPIDFRKKIFERFFRIETSRNRNTGGAGLGLAVVKSIIEMHGGSIEVESEKDELTTFTVIL